MAMKKIAMVEIEIIVFSMMGLFTSNPLVLGLLYRKGGRLSTAL
jgi:hypothetical protein